MQNRVRSNQKNRRKPSRKLGTYKAKSGTERFVVLHPTKGFRDRNINSLLSPEARYQQNFAKLHLETLERNAAKHQEQVTDNTPKVSHRKSG